MSGGTEPGWKSRRAQAPGKGETGHVAAAGAQTSPPRPGSRRVPNLSPEETRSNKKTNPQPGPGSRREGTRAACPPSAAS